MLPKQIISFTQLGREGIPSAQAKALLASLHLFPTPFKGIYYVPLEEERKAVFMSKPLTLLSRAIELFLHSNAFYFSCRTAEEFYGIRWHPIGEVHIVNTKLSRFIDLQARIERNGKKGTYRAKKIARLLSFYGRKIIFHRVPDIRLAKIKHTPYGRYAMRSQITRDKKRFRERTGDS